MKKSKLSTFVPSFGYRNFLSPQDCQLYERILKAFEARVRGAKNSTEKTFRAYETTINKLVEFTAMPPWQWTEEDFEEWCLFNADELKHKVNTQLGNQGKIKNFIHYIVENHRFKEEIKKLTGRYPRQICTEDNCIAKRVENQHEKDMPSFSREDIDKFFGTINEQIIWCGKRTMKAVHSFQRDKAMFATIYAGALRASEGILMGIHSFEEEPFIEELKKFAYLRVQGKGTQGSGKRERNAPVTDLRYPAVMEWYLNTVRPWYQMKADPNELSLFMSERGNRISYATLRKRFNEIVDLAGLSAKDYTLHSFRRAGLTHDSCNMTMQFLQQKAGHWSANTTAGYLPSKDPFFRDEFVASIDKQTKRAKKQQ